MKDLETLAEMITLNLYTAYLENVEKPNSLLIIAKPESGKTEMMKKFIKNMNIAYISDVTAYGIEQDWLPKIEKGEVRHIIIPDLIKPLSRKESTVRTFVTLMNQLIEEGIVTISTYARRANYQTAVRCGLISAITKAELDDQRHHWGRIGFLSRIIPFSYSYSILTVKKIFDSILGLQYLDDRPIQLRLPKHNVRISLPRKYAQSIVPSTAVIAKAQDTYGFRLQKQFQALLQASALEKCRKSVNSQDVDRVLRLMNWINFEENPISSTERDAT